MFLLFFLFFLSREDPPSQSVSVATQELLRLSESNPDGIPKLNIIKDFNIRDIDLMEQHRSLQFMETEIARFNCVNCPHFLEHVSHNFIYDHYTVQNGYYIC